MSDTESGKDAKEADDLHWGFIMGLTGAYLALVDHLAAKGAVDKAQLAQELEAIKRSVSDLPQAVTWIEVTQKQLTGEGDDQK